MIRRAKEMFHFLQHGLKKVFINDAGQLVSGVSNLGHHRSHGRVRAVLMDLWQAIEPTNPKGES